MVGQGVRQHPSGGKGRFNTFDGTPKKYEGSTSAQTEEKKSSEHGEEKKQHGKSNAQGNRNQRNFNNRYERDRDIHSGKDDITKVKEEDAESDEPKKFTGRCRLFLGNLPNDVTEAEFKTLFTEHGEVSEVYLNNQRGFGFVRMVSRKNEFPYLGK